MAPTPSARVGESSHRHKNGFFDLPRELRDEIYTLVLTERDILMCRGCEEHEEDGFAQGLKQFHQLRGICRQARVEASEMFFQRATIHINTQVGMLWGEECDISNMAYTRGRTGERVPYKAAFFLVEDAQRFRFTFQMNAEDDDGMYVMMGRTHLDVSKRDGIWTADVEFDPTPYRPYLQEERIARMKDGRLDTRLMMALQEPLSRMEGLRMQSGFLEELPECIARAETFEMRTLCGGHWAGLSRS